MNKRHERAPTDNRPGIVLVDPSEFLSVWMGMLDRYGFRVRKVGPSIGQSGSREVPEVLKGDPSIIYLDHANETVTDEPFAGRIRQRDKRVLIGLYESVGYENLNQPQLQDYFARAAQHDPELRQYMRKYNVCHTIQGFPMLPTLSEIITSTLEGRTLKESYDRTRIVLP